MTSFQVLEHCKELGYPNTISKAYLQLENDKIFIHLQEGSFVAEPIRIR